MGLVGKIGSSISCWNPRSTARFLSREDPSHGGAVGQPGPTDGCGCHACSPQQRHHGKL